MIRFFCHVEPAGRRSELARQYAEAFVAIGRDVRVIPVEPAGLDDIEIAPGVWKPHPWARHEALLRTPIGIRYVNVVCAHPFWWFRYYTVGCRNVLITDERPEHAEGARDQVPPAVRARLGVQREVVNGRPVEFEAFELPEQRPSPSEVAVKYDAIVVPTAELADAWRAAGARHVAVIGIDLAERANDLLEVLGAG